MKEKYKLYYKDIFLGIVLASETDFPNISEKIEFSSGTLEREKELQNYIEFSINSSDKVLGDNDAYGEFIDSEEFKHQSVIDSLDWTLVSVDGTRTRILVPIFLSDKGICFRFQ